MSFWAGSRAEALHSVAQPVISSRMAAEEDRELVQIATRVERQTLALLIEMAKREDRSVAYVLRRLVEREIAAGAEQVDPKVIERYKEQAA